MAFIAGEDVEPMSFEFTFEPARSELLLEDPRVKDFRQGNWIQVPTTEAS
jgi:hypothetical protein